MTTKITKPNIEAMKDQAIAEAMQEVADEHDIPMASYPKGTDFITILADLATASGLTLDVATLRLLLGGVSTILRAPYVAAGDPLDLLEIMLGRLHSTGLRYSIDTERGVIDLAREQPNMTADSARAMAGRTDPFIVDDVDAEALAYMRLVSRLSYYCAEGGERTPGLLVAAAAEEFTALEEAGSVGPWWYVTCARSDGNAVSVRVSGSTPKGRPFDYTLCIFDADLRGHEEAAGILATSESARHKVG